MSELYKYFGKYQGTVVNNVDPYGLGRIQLNVPGVSGSNSTTWALPAHPTGGLQMGLFSVPTIGSGVWVEFEGGECRSSDLDRRYWKDPAAVPAFSQQLVPGIPGLVMQTPAQNGIVISDAPGPSGGIMLISRSGAMILINDTGITITNNQGAKIQMEGPKVIINEGALTVV